MLKKLPIAPIQSRLNLQTLSSYVINIHVNVIYSLVYSCILQATQSTKLFRFLALERDFSILQNVLTGSGASLSSYSVDTWGSGPSIRGQKLTFYLHPVPSLIVRGAYLHSAIHLHGIHRDNCALYSCKRFFLSYFLQRNFCANL
jgi:hypothetical protein